MYYICFILVLLLGWSSSGYAMYLAHIVRCAVVTKQGGSASKMIMAAPKRELVVTPVLMFNKRESMVPMIRPSQIPLVIETHNDFGRALLRLEQEKEKIQSELHKVAGKTDTLTEEQLGRICTTYTSLCCQSILLHERRQRRTVSLQEKHDLEPENSDKT